MNETSNLSIKNDYFGEVDYDKLSQEMKDKALFILMLVIMKRNGEIKSRGYTNGSCQRVCIDKNEHTSPALEFCSVKHARGVVGKEQRGTATVGLPYFFLQIIAYDDDVPLFVKLTGAVDLLLVESDEYKWRKKLRRENIKQATHTVCNKTTRSALRTTLIAREKIDKNLKGCRIFMSPYDPRTWSTMIVDDQLVLLLHIDDDLITHLSLQITTKHIKLLDSEHRSNGLLEATRDKDHEHLGVALCFIIEGSCAYSQFVVIKKFWLRFLEDQNGSRRSVPTSENLVKESEDRERLDDDKNE